MKLFSFFGEILFKWKLFLPSWMKKLLNRPIKFTLEEYEKAVLTFSNEEDSLITERQKLVLAEVLRRDLARRKKTYENRLEKLSSLNEDSSKNTATENKPSDDQQNKPFNPSASHTRESSSLDSESEPTSEETSKNRKPKSADVVIKHELSEKTDRSCPKCLGNLYKDKDRVQIRIISPDMFQRERHECETVVCEDCGFAKSADPGFDKDQLVCEFSPEAAASLIINHYYLGMPFKRIETLLSYSFKNYRASTLWDVCNEASDRLRPLFLALWIFAREHAKSFRIDDSGAKILSINKSIRDGTLPPKRTGVNTTGIYFDIPDKPTVSLFTTGLQHAGEISEVLAKSRKKSAKLIRVCDAASKNFSATEKFIDACCNEHAFAYFRRLRENHPQDYEFVAEVYGNVFENERYCHKHGLSGRERLDYHKKFSKPEMLRLQTWVREKIKSAYLEENSDIGKAIHYLANQFYKLTEFLRTEDVPLDSNRIEQMLRIAKRYFKNSSFYKNETGAEVGDLFMSIIRTAINADISPLAYLSWCLKNHEDLASYPEKYFPWEFKKLNQQNQSLAS